MKKKGRAIKVFLLILIAGLIGAICYYALRPKEIVKLLLPEIKEISYLYMDVKNDSVFTQIHAVMQNKSLFKLTIDTFYFDFKLNDTELSRELLPLHLEQFRQDTDTIKIPLHLSLKKIMQTIRNVENDSTDMELNTYIVYNTIIGQKKIPHTTKRRIATPIPPEIKILKIEPTGFNIGDKTAKANIKMQLLNKGKYFDIELKNIYYHLRILNTLSSVGFINKTIKVKPGSEQVLNIPAVIELDHPFETALDVLFNNDKVRYEMELKSTLKVNNLQELNNIPMEVHSTGNTELKK